jgi:hypothetical protein
MRQHESAAPARHQAAAGGAIPGRANQGNFAGNTSGTARQPPRRRSGRGETTRRAAARSGAAPHGAPPWQRAPPSAAAGGARRAPPAGVAWPFTDCRRSAAARATGARVVPLTMIQACRFPPVVDSGAAGRPSLCRSAAGPSATGAGRPRLCGTVRGFIPRALCLGKTSHWRSQAAGHRVQNSQGNFAGTAFCSPITN